MYVTSRFIQHRIIFRYRNSCKIKIISNHQVAYMKTIIITIFFMNRKYYTQKIKLSTQCKMFFLEISSILSLTCYSCTGCYGQPTTTSSGSVCMVRVHKRFHLFKNFERNIISFYLKTYTANCVTSSMSVTSVGLSAMPTNTMCGTVTGPFTSTVNGISMSCTGTWSCCYTNYCNTCPSSGCTYTSGGSSGSTSSPSRNNGNILSTTASDVLIKVIISWASIGWLLLFE